MQERSKKLLKNSSMIGIGSIISKVTQYLVLSLCTYWMSRGEYGLADICVSTASLLIPILCLDISQAAFRFSKNENKKGLITFSMLISLCGSALCFAFTPLSSYVPRIGQYWLFISLLILCESFYNVLKEYTRGKELSKLYIFGGVLNSAFQIAGCVLLVFYLQMGIVGYILALCLGYLTEIVFLFVGLKIPSCISLVSIKKSEVKDFLRFCLPLMPNTIMWWIISISDRYFVLYMIDESAAGLYSVAAKIPALITIVTTIFFKAWEMSAISEKDSADRDKYTSKMFQRLSVLLFVTICVLFVGLRLLIKILVSPDFFDGWQYSTVLIVAAGFAACQSFVGTAYTVEKDSLGCLKTTIVTAVSNIILNYFLIKAMGIMGAAVATLISYVIVFVYRLFDTRKYIKININWLLFIISASILIAASILLPIFNKWYYLISVVAFIAIVSINFLLIKNDVLQIVHLTKKNREDGNI